jgi:hypothetical protein
MIVLGIDWSLTSAAITSYDTEDNSYKFFAFKQRKKDESFDSRLILLEYPLWDSDEQRYSLLSTMLHKAVVDHSGAPVHAFFESYAFGGSGAVFNIAESTGLMKNILYVNGCTIGKFAPTSVKKFATGSGSAKKREMMTAFQNDGFDPYKMMDVLDKGTEKIPSPLSDIVDSYFVLKCGLKELG